LYSFINDTNVPRYRFHCNVPSKADILDPTVESPYDIREQSFRYLERFQHKYSTVWEVIHNNLDSIFYFDKTADKERDMVVYEIDPDVKPKTGQNKARFVSKLTLEGSHRQKPLLADRPENTAIDTLFKDERRQTAKDGDAEYGRKERTFQYSIIRFMIRSGIFNPRDGAYIEYGLEHKFKDLLKEAYELFVGKKYEEHSGYNQILLEELGELNLTALNSIVATQFSSSRKRQATEQEKGKWINFDHAEKYSTVEDAQLDLVITLFDLV
jgi:hypothetical protein